MVALRSAKGPSFRGAKGDNQFLPWPGAAVQTKRLGAQAERLTQHHLLEQLRRAERELNTGPEMPPRDKQIVHARQRPNKRQPVGTARSQAGPGTLGLRSRQAGHK